jgi:hypothetical protein
VGAVHQNPAVPFQAAGPEGVCQTPVNRFLRNTDSLFFQFPQHSQHHQRNQQKQDSLGGSPPVHKLLDWLQSQCKKRKRHQDRQQFKKTLQHYFLPGRSSISR